MTKTWDALFTAILITCAILTTGIVAKRELFAQPSNSELGNRQPVFVKNWESLEKEGIRIGPASARVRLTEFSDFECPFCGTLHNDIASLLLRYPGQISLTYIHFPLPMHRFARLAARAAECGDEQGKFVPMYDSLFKEQDLFGIKTWSDYASEAGVPNLSKFDSCMKETAPLPRIETGVALGKKMDIQFTPTLIINGWRLGGTPSATEMESMVRAVLDGKPPV